MTEPRKTPPAVLRRGGIYAARLSLLHATPRVAAMLGICCIATSRVAGQTAVEPPPPALVAGAPLFASDSAGPALSLTDAEQIASQNNPTFLEALIARHTSAAALRTAWGGVLPQLTGSFGAQYQGAGSEILSGVTFGIPSSILASNYQLGVSYQISAATLLTPGYARANRDAAEADVGTQAAALRDAVAEQYVSALEARAKVGLEDTLMADAELQLALARARQAVGSATPLDVRRAEVALGQQRVEQLQARNQAAVELLRLFQQMGVTQPSGVRLTTDFVVAQPGFTLDSVLASARTGNPDLVALRAREHAASVGVHRAHGLYAPVLTLGTGIGGYTYQYNNPNTLIQQDQSAGQQEYGLCLALDSVGRAAAGFPPTCTGLALTSAQTAQIRSANRQFPFGFTTLPTQFSASLSLPLFDGFAREERVEEATAVDDNARYAVRARELQLTADVTSAYYTLTTAFQTAEIQADNAIKARDELSLAEERYRVGGASSLNVADARASYARAETDHINAVYDYQKAFAALEHAVGRPLR